MAKTPIANFWSQLNRPILALAPMAGLTDSAFRLVCRQWGAGVVYSEMASVTALAYNPKKTLEMLKFSEQERPYVVQLFGSNPEHFKQAVKMVEKEIKPDGIDINFGCPAKKVLRQGAGACLMDNLPLARQIIEAALDSASVPVSIKTRRKVGKTDILSFLNFVSDLPLAALMVHGRSLNEGFSGEVDFGLLAKCRQHFRGIFLVNGGIFDWRTAHLALKASGADGVGIARGAVGRPWIFKEIKEKRDQKVNPCEVAYQHTKLAWEFKGEGGIIEMRKHLAAYVKGLPGARALRQRLVQVKELEEIREILLGSL
ncbi:tRNA-dihydrouridine synthase [Candidatus Parcubacteria bacterium]|nr:MAG: tRNA-dihydrouridine synthase [Candidatus Parcubacteria bacterium]